MLFLVSFFSLADKLLRTNGIPGSCCLSLKVNYDSVSTLLKAIGEEAPEQEDQDFQGSLVLSASSSSIKEQLAQMRALLASFICTESPPLVPRHLHFFDTYKQAYRNTTRVLSSIWKQQRASTKIKKKVSLELVATIKNLFFSFFLFCFFPA